MQIARMVINLPDRVDRKQEMEDQLQRVGWSADFIQAVRPEAAGDFPSVGARGCFLSHLACLEAAKIANPDLLILLEDDANFSNNFLLHWPAVEKFITSKPFDFFYGGFSAGREGIEAIPSDQSILCAHFIIFSPRGIEQALLGLRAIIARTPGHQLGGPMHVDGAYSTIRQQNPDLKTYTHSPALAYQRASKTDIGKPHLIDKCPPIARTLRKMKRVIITSRAKLPGVGFRSFVALPFHCFGTILVGIGMLLLGIGSVIHSGDPP